MDNGAIEVTPIVSPTTVRAVILVGCGGGGARVAPKLPKMLRRGDELVLIDNDRFEFKNLYRQHISEADLGKPKSLAVAERIKSECDRVGVNLSAFNKRLDRSVLEHILTVTGENQAIILGCVDNVMTRALLHHETVSTRYDQPVLYIDAGNELRSGQVVWSCKGWEMRCRDDSCVSNGPMRAHFTQELFPNIIDADAEESTNDCTAELRMSQTLQANDMASALMTCMLAWFLDGIPTSTAALTFSTYGPVKAFPIRRRIMDQLSAVGEENGVSGDHSGLV